jgi:hypothetical protein
MIPFSSDGAATPRPSSILSRPVLDARMLDARMLGAQIGRRRTALAALEAEMTAACEADAIGTRSRTSGAADHAGWDRATWHRYLAAAMRLESEYGPRMRRLRQEIGQLERLMRLPIAA